MADLLLHFAVGVFVASRFHFERKARYLVGSAAVLPDLDALFGRMSLAWGAEWFGWSAVETRDALHLFGHGGILHSVLVALVVALLALLFSLDWKVGAAVGVAWLSHGVLDAFSTEGALLWWPITGAVVLNPLFVPAEPVLVVLSVLFLGGTIMGDLYLGDRAKELGDRTRLILRKFGPRLAKGAAQMGGFVLVFLLVSKTVLLSVDRLDGPDVTAAGFPRFNVHERTPEGYLVTSWDGFGQAERRVLVPFVPDGTPQAMRAPVDRALCLAGALPRGLGLLHPVVLEADDRIVVGEAALAAGFAGPAERTVLVVAAGDRAWRADPATPDTRERVVPGPLLDATGC